MTVEDREAKQQRWYRVLRRAVYWAVPVVVLYLVLRQVDVALLRSSLSKTNPWLVGAGLCLYPVMILIGALRWRFLLAHYHRRQVPVQFTVRHYWIGLALGVFAPGSIGWDVYRVVVSGRRFGQYGANVAIILVEKFLALVTCLSLALGLYPLLPIDRSPEVERLLRVGALLFAASLLLVAAMGFVFRNRLLTGIVDRLEVRLGGVMEKISGRFVAARQDQEARVSLRLMVEPLVAPGKALPVLAFSFGIQLVAAVRGQIFFRALGYDLPFVVNLFVSPVLFFVFLLPISFGSLGIREGAFILVYGLFGVPPEIALLVSFFNLSGLLLNNLIGGVVMLVANLRVQESAEITAQDEQGSQEENGPPRLAGEIVKGP